jgi:hypothetical protein
MKIQESQKNKTLGQEQIESVIQTNKHQRIVLYLTLFVASVTLFTQLNFSWRENQKSNNHTNTTIVDTVKVHLTNGDKNLNNLNDSIKVSSNPKSFVKKQIDKKANN